MIRRITKHRPSRQVSTFVAMGDSFTAGNGCFPEDRWADIVAAELRRANADLRYVNVARDGADSQDVADQVAEAVQFGPDLVTVVCGANDVILNLKPDISSFTGRFSLILGRLQSSLPAASILTATYPEGWRLEGIGPRTQRRIRSGMTEVNLAIREVSDDRGIPCLDVVDHPGIKDRDNFGTDGMHPSQDGHRQAAAEFRWALQEHFRIETPESESHRQYK